MSGVGVLLLFQPCPADGPTPFAQVLIALMTVYLTAVDRFKEGMSHQNDVLPAARGSWTEGGGGASCNVCISKIGKPPFFAHFFARENWVIAQAWRSAD